MHVEHKQTKLIGKPQINDINTASNLAVYFWGHPSSSQTSFLADEIKFFFNMSQYITPFMFLILIPIPQSHSMMLPPLCFTVDMVFLVSYMQPFFLQTWQAEFTFM